jgi:hypothetical protein
MTAQTVTTAIIVWFALILATIDASKRKKSKKKRPSG